MVLDVSLGADFSENSLDKDLGGQRRNSVSICVNRRLKILRAEKICLLKVAGFQISLVFLIGLFDILCH